MFGLDPESSVTLGLMRSWETPGLESPDAPHAPPASELPTALAQMMGAS